jgi:hypothetical protein
MGVPTANSNAQNTNYNEGNHEMFYPGIQQAQDSNIPASIVSPHLSPTRWPTRSRHSSFSSNPYPTSPFTPATPPPSYISVSHHLLGSTGPAQWETQSTDTLSTVSNISELPTPANDTPETSVSHSLREEIHTQPMEAIDASISPPLQNGPVEATENPRSTRFSLRFRRRPVGSTTRNSE